MVISSNPMSEYKLSIFSLLFFSFINNIMAIYGTEINVTLNNEIFELNSTYIINQIILPKTNNNSFNYLFGIFEASNNITFEDALIIAMIKEDNVNDSNKD